MSAGDQQQTRAGETVAGETAEGRDADADAAERDRRRQERRQRQPGEAPSMGEADRANGEPGAQD
jgi:hypothetical protein